MHPLAALTLTSPWMLMGAAAVFGPVLAHLLRRRAMHRVVFPTIRLLVEAAAEQAAPRRARRRVLLALRCLAVLLIVGAFARPVWHAAGRPAAMPGQGEVVLLLIDRSASMAMTSDGVSIDHAVRDAARRTLQALDASVDRAGVIFVDDRPRAALPELVSNPPVLVEAVDAEPVGSARADWPAALAKAAEVLHGVQAGRRRVLVFSDLQASNFADVSWDALASDADRPVDVTVVPVQAAAAENLSWGAMQWRPRRPVRGRPVSVSIELSNHAARSTVVQAGLDVDGRRVATRAVSIEAGQTRPVEFVLRFEKVGEHRVRFALGPDALAADNRSHVILQVDDALPVAVIGRSNDAGVRHLVGALRPVESATPYRVNVLPPTDVDAASLASSHFAVVADAADLTRQSMDALTAFARSGGGVLMFAGRGSKLDAPTDVPWWPQISSHHELPRRLDRGLWEAAPLDVFDAVGVEAMRRQGFHRTAPLTARHAEARHLLHFEGGTPAFSILETGQGRWASWNGSLQPVEAPWVRGGLFAAWLHATLEWLVPSPSAPFHHRVGDAVTLELADVGEGRFDAIDPKGRPTWIETEWRGGRLRVRFDRVVEPGFYAVRRDDQIVAHAAVNVDAREGHTERLDAKALQGAMISAHAESAHADGAVIAGRGQALWPTLVATALLVLLVEMTLLWRWKR